MRLEISLELERDDSGSLVVTNLSVSNIPTKELTSQISCLVSTLDTRYISKLKATWTMTPEGKWLLLGEPILN